MALDYTRIESDTPFLLTRIPEYHTVRGLEYGAHFSAGAYGWSGYYVRPLGSKRWGVAQLTPAGDELPEPEDGETLDEAIVRCIEEELA